MISKSPFSSNKRQLRPLAMSNGGNRRRRGELRVDERV